MRTIGVTKCAKCPFHYVAHFVRYEQADIEFNADSCGLGKYFDKNVFIEDPLVIPGACPLLDEEVKLLVER